MAEDTRLAEACLLLNYSEQSYKEQMSNQSPNGQHELKHEQLVEKPTTDVQIFTSNIKQEYIIGSSEDQNRTDSPHEVAEQSINVVTKPQSDDEHFYETSSSSRYKASCYNHHDTDAMQPINSLLAAVNCALPGLKVRPTILQRSSSLNNPTKSFANHSNLPDHDYCQSEQGLSTGTSANDCTETVEQPSIGAESHELGASSTVRKPEEVRIKSRRKQKQLELLSPPKAEKKHLKLVAIHLGAGNCNNEVESRRIAKSICEEVMLQKSSSWSSRKKKKNCCFSNASSTPSSECRGYQTDDEKVNAESAVVQLVKLMEDHQALNCGYGSNLNIRGQVECDASLMSDRNLLWTGVGSVSGCKNPIILAKSLYDHQTVPRPLGLVQPNVLVGSGAKQWMRQHCPYLCIVDSKLVSSKAFGTYQKLKSRYDAAVKACGEIEAVSSVNDETRSTKLYKRTELCSTTLDHGFYCSTTRDNLRKVPSFARTINKFKSLEERNSSCENGLNGSGSTETVCPDIKFQASSHYDRMDTVGAITVDSDNCFASAISSGGLLLKYKGRLGQAAIPGAGCWSENSVAVTTTGVGEYLTLNMFAKRFYDKIVTLRLLYDLGHIERKPDLSNLFNCGMEECFDDLMKSPALTHVPLHERLVGMLSVSTLNSKDSSKRTHVNDLYLSYAHNTNSMCVAYMTCNDSASNVVVSRKLDEDSNGSALVKTIKLSPDPNERFDDSIVNGSS